ncbi:MAG: hypothetical protein WCD35_00120, partial [Mycobacteriales bacterium]
DAELASVGRTARLLTYLAGMSGSQDYDSDHDPLGYMTSDYRSPYLAESSLDMERRFFLRARSAPRLWQRLLVRVLVAIPLIFIGVGLVLAAAQVSIRLMSR